MNDMKVNPGTRSGTLPVLFLFIVLAIVVVSSLACSNSPVLFSGIEGEIRIGPISPVSAPGETNSKPYSTKMRVRSLPDGKVVAEFTSDSQGKFRAVLAPGRYEVEPENAAPLPMGSTVDVTVTAGQFTHVQIVYDSGIR